MYKYFLIDDFPSLNLRLTFAHRSLIVRLSFGEGSY